MTNSLVNTENQFLNAIRKHSAILVERDHMEELIIGGRKAKEEFLKNVGY
jgi:hypothetical protein